MGTNQQQEELEMNIEYKGFTIKTFSSETHQRYHVMELDIGFRVDGYSTLNNAKGAITKHLTAKEGSIDISKPIMVASPKAATSDDADNASVPVPDAKPAYRLLYREDRVPFSSIAVGATFYDLATAWTLTKTSETTATHPATSTPVEIQPDEFVCHAETPPSADTKRLSAQVDKVAEHMAAKINAQPDPRSGPTGAYLPRDTVLASAFDETITAGDLEDFEALLAVHHKNSDNLLARLRYEGFLHTDGSPKQPDSRSRNKREGRYAGRVAGLNIRRRGSPGP